MGDAGFKWKRFGTPTDYILGGDSPADLTSLEVLDSSFDGVILRDLNLKAHSVLAKQQFWKDYFTALTTEYQRLVHHANFLKYIFDYATYLGEETLFDKKIQNLYVTLGFPFSTSFSTYINADDPDFKEVYPIVNGGYESKAETFFNKKIFWKQFTIENIVFLRKWLGSLYGYRQIFSSIFRRGAVFLTFKYETSEFTADSEHRFRLFDFTTLNRVLPPAYGGNSDSTYPDTTTIQGVIDYSLVTLDSYKFDDGYQFDGTFGESGTTIQWDSGLTASNTNKGLSLEITCDRLLYHYNTLYNPTTELPEICLMDIPWVDYILNLSTYIKRGTDKIKVGSQLTFVNDFSNTITPYTGSGSDNRLYYTHPNVRSKFQIIKTKYDTGSIPTKIKVGTGAYIDWDSGADTDEFFLRRDQILLGIPALWQSRWDDGGTINDLKNPVYELSIGSYEKDKVGLWDFIHCMCSSAKFKNELLDSQTIKVNKYPAYFYLTVTAACSSSGDITITVGSASETISLTTSEHNTASKVAEAIRQTSFEGWEVQGSEDEVYFFPDVTGTYNAPATVFDDTDTTGVTATVTGTPAVENTVINLPHTYIAPGSVKLRIEFSAGTFNSVADFPLPDEITHTLIIKEIRQNNQWETVSYVKSSYKSYLDNSGETILEYYDGYKDITDNDSVYYDSSAVDDSGNFLTSYFKTQETIAFNMQDVAGFDATIDHAAGTVTIAPQLIRNAFKLAQDNTFRYEGSGDRYTNVDTNIYCTYNIRANETLRNTATLGITEVGLFNESGNMIAYGTFPPIIYDSLKHHVSFNFFLLGDTMAPISI